MVKNVSNHLVNTTISSSISPIFYSIKKKKKTLNSYVREYVIFWKDFKNFNFQLRFNKLKKLSLKLSNIRKQPTITSNK